MAPVYPMETENQRNWSKICVHIQFSSRKSTLQPLVHQIGSSAGAQGSHVITSLYTSVTSLRLHTPWRKHQSNNNMKEKKKQQQQQQ